MELSLFLSFYLRRNLRGCTVGTAVVFLVELSLCGSARSII
jgi:hypothetical protein